jgi:hypothetical protein
MSASMSSRREYVAAAPVKKVSAVSTKEAEAGTYISIFLIAVGAILLWVARDTGSMLAFVPGAAGVFVGVRHYALRLWDAIRGDD